MSKTEAEWMTEYGVQLFGYRKKKLTPAEVRIARGKDHALRLGERLASSHPGVLVFSRRMAPQLDEYDPPVLLAEHGEIPSDLPFAADV